MYDKSHITPNKNPLDPKFIPTIWVNGYTPQK